MALRISTEKQQQIMNLYKEGKSVRFIARETSSGNDTIKKVLTLNNLKKKELSPIAKKIYARQKKVDFAALEALKNQITKDQRFFSNLHDPLKGCGRPALFRCAKEANELSDYSVSIREAIATAKQIAALFIGQQEQLGFNEHQ
jgi:DNA invertase Pin-like site-specific DNA recombinase